MSLPLSPYILLHTPDEVDAMIALAAKHSIFISCYQTGDLSGLWYWFKRDSGTGIPDGICRYGGGTNVSDLRQGLLGASRRGVPTNSIAHFIAMSHQLMDEPAPSP